MRVDHVAPPLNVVRVDIRRVRKMSRIVGDVQGPEAHKDLQPQNEEREERRKNIEEIGRKRKIKKEHKEREEREERAEGI